MRTMTTEYKPLILQQCPCKFFLPAVTQKNNSYKPTRKIVLTTIYFPNVTCRFWDFVRLLDRPPEENVIMIALLTSLSPLLFPYFSLVTIKDNRRQRRKFFESDNNRLFETVYLTFYTNITCFHHTSHSTHCCHLMGVFFLCV